jgi:hypothetical protein
MFLPGGSIVNASLPPSGEIEGFSPGPNFLLPVPSRFAIQTFEPRENAIRCWGRLDWSGKSEPVEIVRTTKVRIPDFMIIFLKARGEKAYAGVERHGR